MTRNADPPPLPRPVVSDQRWRDLAFLHWAVEPAAVAPYLPPGTRPDVTPDGRTWVGLVPFRMARAGAGRGVPVPWFGWFLETNIRLYSVDDAGRHGVVFRSLDASRLGTVLLARFGFRVPYYWSSMQRSVVGSRHAWRSRRRWPGPPATSEIVLDVGDRVIPTPLEDFLTLRWGMHTSFAGRTWWVPNEHGRWPLHSATLVSLTDRLGDAAGFPLRGEPDLRPLWSPGVHTRFGRPVEVPTGR